MGLRLTALRAAGAPLLAKCLPIQKFVLAKVSLKAVVKVALSLQRLASARQLKISNHTMIVRVHMNIVTRSTMNTNGGNETFFNHLCS